MTGYLPGLEGAAKASYAEPESSQNPLTLLNCKDKESNKKHESSTIENENEQNYELPDLIVDSKIALDVHKNNKNKPIWVVLI